MRGRSFFVLTALLMLSALGQPSPEDLESRLAGTAGPERLELLVTLAASKRQEDAALALEWGEEALELLKSHPDRARQLEVLNTLAYVHTVLGDYDPALELGSKAEDLAREVGDRSARAFAFLSIGRVYRSRADYSRALEAYLKATTLYIEAGDELGLGDALKDTGVVHWMQGDYPKALEYFIQARRHYEESGDRRRTAAILNNIGMIHRRLKQPSRALELYLQALEIRRQVGPGGALANVLNNIGNIHKDQGEPAKALDFYLESLDVGPKDQYSYGNTLINIGAAYQDLGELDRAMQFYKEATDIKKASGDANGVAQLLLRVGSIQRQRNQLSSSLESLRQGLEITQQLGAKDEIKDAQWEVSETYAKMGRYREALEAFRNYERVKSEIFNAENSTTIAEMEARFESDRKGKAIEILEQQRAISELELKRQSATRKALYGGLALLSLVVSLLYNMYRLKSRSARVIEQQNHELEQALVELKNSERERRRLQREQVRREERERYIIELEVKNDEVEARTAEMERFTYTLSHDLRSPLVTMRGFLGLLKKDSQAGDLKGVEKDLGRIDAAVRHMGQLLDELLEMVSIGRIFGASEEVSLSELAREARARLVEEIADRSFEVDIAPDLPIVYGDRRRLSEVLYNLIGNAVKFTVDRHESMIEVGCRRQDSERVFYVRDNGIGVEPEYLELVFGLFERLDARTEGTGVGLALVKRIVEVHGGRVWAESEGLGKGSTFCFTLARDPTDRAHRRRDLPTLRAADYAKLFQYAHDAILILDPAEERILEANHQACELYGFSRGELIGRSMLELTPAHSRAADHVGPTLESRDRYRFETIQKRKDLSEIRLDVHASMVEFRGQRAILSINRDVTDRWRQDEALARQREELEEEIRGLAARLEEATRALESRRAEHRPQAGTGE